MRDRYSTILVDRPAAKSEPVNKIAAEQIYEVRGVILSPNYPYRLQNTAENILTGEQAKTLPFYRSLKSKISAWCTTFLPPTPIPHSKNEIFKEKTQKQPQIDGSYKKIYLYIHKCGLQYLPSPLCLRKECTQWVSNYTFLWRRGWAIYAKHFVEHCEHQQYLDLIVQSATSVNLSPTGPTAGRMSIDNECHLCQLGGPVGKRERNSRKKKITKSLYTIELKPVTKPSQQPYSRAVGNFIYQFKKAPGRKMLTLKPQKHTTQNRSSSKNGARSQMSPHVVSTFNEGELVAVNQCK